MTKAIRVHRTPKQKLAVVMAAEIGGLTATAEATGIPKSTIKYWLDDPFFAPYRTKAREDMADEIGTVMHLAWQRVGEALRNGTMEPRDALFAAEKATTLHQLVTGSATARLENRELHDLPDSAYVEAIREAKRLVGTDGADTTPTD